MYAKRTPTNIHITAGKGSSLSLLGAICAGLFYGTSPSAIAQSDNTQATEWRAPAIHHALEMKTFKDIDSGNDATPKIIPIFGKADDPSGAIATYQPGAATVTSSNAFFQSIGTNGRSCFTCHQPQNGWTISAASVKQRFNASGGSDPIFRLVDGATCPTDNIKNIGDKRQAYKLLIEKGLIRIGLPMPANSQFEIDEVEDPYGCTTNPVTGLTNKTEGIVSVYRRPLPATNLNFLTTIMWDGRELSLSSQASDATQGHAQAPQPPKPEQVNQIVNFETNLFSAQLFDNRAGRLDLDGAHGGPVSLFEQLGKFFVGINDPLSLGPAFDPDIFDLYNSPMWQGLQDRESDEDDGIARYRRSIARGERLFNTTKIKITGVAGLNDALGQPTISGFCGTCHDTPDVGNHSVKLPINIGVANAGADRPPALDISGLPVFTLKCAQGPMAGQKFVVTDPGRALISGSCADIGKLKGPILRGLAARAPYFHNGSAATLQDVVNFYDQRFAIGFSDDEKTDLVNFLNSL
jgi:cytochrome c peroxidase